MNFNLINCICLISFLLVKKIHSQSRLDVVELNEYTYNIGIKKTLKLESDLSIVIPFDNDNESEIKQEILTLKNKFGQAYECKLPKFEDLPDDDDEEHRLSNGKKIGSPYNFTLINEKVTKSTGQLAKTNLCIYRSLGWWTYEFCFGSHASQYHMMNNGTIEGEIINLGNFTSDFDWLTANESNNFPISSGILYHEQYYELGSICELTQKPRRVVAKIFCDEQATTEIDLISEVETCSYEMHINSNTVCNVPSFSKKQNKFDIDCNPVLDAMKFQEYLLKKEVAEKGKELKKEEMTRIEKELEKKEALEKIETSINSNELLSENNILENMNDQLTLPQEMILNKPVDTNLDNILVDSISDTTSKILEELNVDTEHLNDLNTKLMNKNLKLLEEIKESGVESSELKDSLDNALKNLNKEYKSITKDAGILKDEFLGKIEKGSLEMNENDILKLTDQLVEKLAKKNSQNELTEESLNEEIEEIEKNVGYNIQMGLPQETNGQKLQIKIIKIDSNGKNINSDDLSSIFSSLMKEDSQIKEIEKMTSNYNYVYDSEDQGDFEETEEKHTEKDKTENKRFITTEHINIEQFLSKSGDTKEEDEPDKLIIF